MNNNKINILGWMLFILSAVGFIISSIGNFWGWMLFIVSAVGFIISSIGNVWAMFGSVVFLIACIVFLIPYFRKNKE